MRRLTAGELERMRRVQAEAMADECVLLRFAPALDEYGTETAVYAESAPVRCGFNPESGAARERRRADGTIAVIDALLRLAHADGAGLTGRDRVRVTHRCGEPLAPPLDFGLDGPPQMGETCLVLRLVQVE